MAENVILSETEILFDAGETTHDPIGLVVGNTYKIIWDSVEYVDVAKQENVLGYDAVLVGNLALVGATEPTNFPFLFGDVPEMGVSYFVSEDTETTSHTVAIYQTVEDEPQEEVGIVIKNYSGVPIEYKGVEKVMFNTADGGRRVYSKGEALEDVEIELDFSSGDQTVKAAEGMLFKSVLIKKPDTLVDENIAENVNMAGIIGSLARGKDVKIATGTFTGSPSPVTVSHNLGRIPDVVLICGKYQSRVVDSVPAIMLAFGMSESFNKLAGFLSPIAAALRQRTSSSSFTDSFAAFTSYIEYTGSLGVLINTATSNTVTFGNASYATNPGFEYYWVAIGGLT